MFSVNSKYEDQTALLTDGNDTTCIELYPSTSGPNLFKMKIFNAQLCLNVSTVTIVTENLCCDTNGIIVYSSLEANELGRNEFTGNFKEFKYTGKAHVGNKNECTFVTKDEKSGTCDFVYIFVFQAEVASKVCEIRFNT